MTKAEAEATIRSIGRTCRGRELLSRQEQQDWRAKFDSIMETKRWANSFTMSEHWSDAMSIVVTVEKQVGLLGPAVADFEWEKLAQRFQHAVYSFESDIGRPCGADFNNTVVAGPWDGEMHDYVCPKCGQTGVYVAPVFPELRPDQAEYQSIG